MSCTGASKTVPKEDSLRGSSVNIGAMQRRLAWPLRKDDTHETVPKKGGESAFMRSVTADAVIRKGGRCGWEPSSSSNFSIRAFRAYPLHEIRQAVLHGAVRGSSISVSSTLPTPSQVSTSSGSAAAPFAELVLLLECRGNHLSNTPSRPPSRRAGITLIALTLLIIHINHNTTNIHSISGGTTCLTLLVQRRCSSNEAKPMANYGDP